MTAAATSVVFFMRHGGLARNYEPVLVDLASRGVRLMLCYDMMRVPAELALCEQLAAAYPNVTVEPSPARRLPAWWQTLATFERQQQDYLRYFTPRYASAHGLRERVRESAPPLVRAVVERAAAGGTTVLGAVAAMTRVVERALPTDPGIDAFLAERRPDVMMVTPLIDFGSPQVDYVKSARRAGIPVAAVVASWDNLTNKGVLRVRPDAVFVWNEAQRQEAVSMHAIPADRVVVTGAQTFDHWFDWTPTETREAFCARVGLDANRPILLYLCSSRQIAPDELPFVRRWLALVRGSSDPLLAAAGVLIRPHPTQLRHWLNADLSAFENVAIWPRTATSAFDPSFKHDYFHSMHVCAAAVGVNTSGMIEAGILGRPVCTWRAAEFAASQDGTLHFEHLVHPEYGLLHVAETSDSHLADLSASLRLTGRDARSNRFVGTFVRPYGRTEAATPRFVEAVLALARPAGAAGRADLLAWCARPAAWAAAVMLQVHVRGGVGRAVIRGVVWAYVRGLVWRERSRGGLDRFVGRGARTFRQARQLASRAPDWVRKAWRRGRRRADPATHRARPRSRKAAS